MITQQPYTVAPRRSLSLAQCSTLAIASYHLHRLSRLGGYPLYRTLTSLLGKAAEVSSQVYCRPDSQIYMPPTGTCLANTRNRHLRIQKKTSTPFGKTAGALSLVSCRPVSQLPTGTCLTDTRNHLRLRMKTSISLITDALHN